MARYYSIVIKSEIKKKFDIDFNEYVFIELVRSLSKNRNNNWCIASKKTLGEMMDLTERQVFNLINQTIKKKLIEKNAENTNQLRSSDLWIDALTEYKEVENKYKHKKPYYNDMRVVKKGNKLYCIPNEGGEWLEFAGTKKDIVFK